MQNDMEVVWILQIQESTQLVKNAVYMTISIHDDWNSCLYWDLCTQVLKSTYNTDSSKDSYYQANLVYLWFHFKPFVHL